MSILTVSVLGITAVLLAVQLKGKGSEYGTYIVMAAGLCTVHTEETVTPDPNDPNMNLDPNDPDYGDPNNPSDPVIPVDPVIPGDGSSSAGGGTSGGGSGSDSGSQGMSQDIPRRS